MMRIYGAGLVQNDVFAKALRMLASPYKCLKNVAIDCHPHYRFLENALQIFRTLTNAITNNTNVLQTHYKRSECVPNACRILFIFYSFANTVANDMNLKRNHPQCQGAWKKYVIFDPSLLLKHTPLCCNSQIAIYTIKKTILLGEQKVHGTLARLSYIDG